jgi:Flp pilus assembly protein CpaB
MLRRRSHRITTTVLVVLSLLFSQLALAGYVCPQQADTRAVAAMMEAGIPCEGMDPQQPVLCHQHAADAGKSFEAVKLPTVSLPAIVQVLELPRVPEARTVLPTASYEALPPPDPLFLSTLRLRV